MPNLFEQMRAFYFRTWFGDRRTMRIRRMQHWLEYIPRSDNKKKGVHSPCMHEGMRLLFLFTTINSSRSVEFIVGTRSVLI